jgi:hypothetical protein
MEELMVGGRRRKTTRAAGEERKGCQRLEEEEWCEEMLFEIHKTVERRNASRIYSMPL